ncbi:Sarcolemmal membrane-associated protein putative isoform 2 [Tripterygium wilfordii]|uniref:Sarcolemmal membrane-associated protein putative isoform 2 n=1 Tax=Tripterygium wilfordii TaxID=458696 RepID=A0A7J7DR80_TRIWF|nr:protein FLX-like 2 [Tripterygium wilfordii]KAF5748880.1 Sarcolemmal membrane-associated protein putative isoform 2 [Tripterygium wilfordii]
MGSKGRILPPHLRRPLPGPGIMHPDPFGSRIHPPPHAFSPFDMLPPPEVMEQKLAAQHLEIEKLAVENQRLAATHGTLRQELAAAQHEKQILHAQIEGIKSEREQQMKSLMDKIAKMESELQSAEPVKLELQKARSEVENLVVIRQELMSKVLQLSQDLQRAHADVQHIPALMSELESLRQEYHHCRMSYDYEKKLYNDHLESLQVMEKNYITMAREVEKLRAELTITAHVDHRTGGPYGSTAAFNETQTSGNPVGQNSYEDGYGVTQGQAPPSAVSGSSAGAGVAGGAAGVNAGAGTTAYIGAQSGSFPSWPGHDASKGTGFNASKGSDYDAQRAPSYDAQRGHGYDMQKGSGYDPPRGPGYDTQRGPSYDAQRGPGYDVQATGYDASRGATGSQIQIAPANNVPYGSATPPAPAGSVYAAHPRGGNPGGR